MKVFTVTELTFAIKRLLEGEFRAVSLKGEISNLKVQSSGHIYFTLKDEASQISAVLFRGNASHLARMPKEGDQVVVGAEVSLYAPRGQYQLVVRSLEFAGIGELLQRLEMVKKELHALGWFDPKRKKKLPPFPKKIGVITSPTGAVIQDILHVLSRRSPSFHLLLYPVKVQGEGAAEEIATAISECNRYEVADLLIVGRGGGSIEDLWAFNEKIVANAIFSSTIPIISAVGHETDFTIADFVADVRAPTPSAAAEIAMRERKELLEKLSFFQSQVLHHILAKIGRKKEALISLERLSFFRSPYSLLTPKIQALDLVRLDVEREKQTRLQEKRVRLQHCEEKLLQLRPDRALEEKKKRLPSLTSSLAFSLQRQIETKKEALTKIRALLHSMHPSHILQKGYAIALRKDGSVLQSTKQAAKGELLDLLLQDGKIPVQIQEIPS